MPAVEQYIQIGSKGRHLNITATFREYRSVTMGQPHCWPAATIGYSNALLHVTSTSLKRLQIGSMCMTGSELDVNAIERIKVFDTNT